MVQLQSDLKSLEDAGIRVVGISYDAVEVLAKFAADEKITFPLKPCHASRLVLCTVDGTRHELTNSETAG